MLWIAYLSTVILHWRVPLAMFPEEHLQQHNSSCLLSHVPPAICLQEHLPPHQWLQAFGKYVGAVFALEPLEQCSQFCLAAVLTCHMLLSSNPWLAGSSCDWHRRACGCFLDGSPSQAPLWKLCQAYLTEERLKGQAMHFVGILIMRIVFQGWWTYQKGT